MVTKQNTGNRQYICQVQREHSLSFISVHFSVDHRKIILVECMVGTFCYYIWQDIIILIYLLGNI